MLVDTSVWIDHLRRGNAGLASRLEAGDVECHPFVIGEIACGNLRRRAEILSLLGSLPRVRPARHEEVLSFVDSMRLAGKGLGWIDMHLIASSRLSHTTLWTLDGRLEAVARVAGVAFPEAR